MDEQYEQYFEEGTDEDFDRYAVEVMNGEGYYNSEGKFVRYHDESWWDEY